MRIFMAGAIHSACAISDMTAGSAAPSTGGTDYVTIVFGVLAPIAIVGSIVFLCTMAGLNEM